MKLPTLTVSLVLTGALCSLAAPPLATPAAKPGTTPAPAGTPVPATPAPAPASSEVFLPTDLEKLRPLLNKPVTLEGTPLKVGESNSKSVRYLNFTSDIGSGVALVFFSSKTAEAFPMEKLNALVGKKIRVNGKLTEYKERLQIEITAAKQIQEVP